MKPLNQVGYIEDLQVQLINSPAKYNTFNAELMFIYL